MFSYSNINIFYKNFKDILYIYFLTQYFGNDNKIEIILYYFILLSYLFFSAGLTCFKHIQKYNVNLAN